MTIGDALAMWALAAMFIAPFVPDMIRAWRGKDE